MYVDYVCVKVDSTSRLLTVELTSDCKLIMWTSHKVSMVTLFIIINYF